MLGDIRRELQCYAGLRMTQMMIYYRIDAGHGELWMGTLRRWSWRRWATVLQGLSSAM